jgi:hypothetical protein
MNILIFVIDLKSGGYKKIYIIVMAMLINVCQSLCHQQSLKDLFCTIYT